MWLNNLMHTKLTLQLACSDTDTAPTSRMSKLVLAVVLIAALFVVAETQAQRFSKEAEYLDSSSLNCCY